MTRREIDQERRNSEGRQSPRSTAISGAHRFGNRAEPTDPRTNNGCRAFLGLRVQRLPTGLLQRLPRGLHGKQNEAVHLLLLFGWRCSIRVKTRLGIFRHGEYRAANLGRQIGDHLFR
ncbi:hypothetical protein D3C72_1761760 [compost metagenome]